MSTTLSSVITQGIQLQATSSLKRIKHMRYLRELVRHYGAQETYRMYTEALESEKSLSLEARRRAMLRPMTLDSEMSAVAAHVNQ